MAAIGRPREFDMEMALDQALTLFWTKGYEGTSLMDLVNALGIKKPSLYAAFGSKEGLFLQALARYKGRLGAVALPAMALPSARDGVEAFLRSLASFQSKDGSPHGCLFVQGALAASDSAAHVARLLCEARAEGVAVIRSGLDRAREQGELPEGTDVAALARFFGTVSQGVSVQAADGASDAELQQTITLAMQCWPQQLAV